MLWVPIPNSHDGEGYCQMVQGDRGAEVLGAWLACVQVASRCDPRGTLLRKSRTPHTAESLASRTRLSVTAFDEMLKRAVSEDVSWMELVELPDVKEIPHPPAEIPQAPAVPSFFPSLHSIPSDKGVQGEKIPRFKPADIDTIYGAYPRKVGAGAAKTAIHRALVKLAGANSDPVAFLLDRTAAFAKSPAGNRGTFTPHPATWFNAARYHDDPKEWEQKEANGKPVTTRSAEEIAAAKEANDRRMEDAFNQNPTVAALAAANFALKNVNSRRQDRAVAQRAKVELMNLEEKR